MRLVTTIAAALLTVISVASGAIAQDFIDVSEKEEVEKLVSRTLIEGRSGRAVVRELSDKLSVSVVPELTVSRSTGAVCDRCTDFCRDYTMTISLDGGLDTLVYNGRNCIIEPNQNPNSGPWRAARPLVLVSRRSIIPSEQFTKVKDYLTAGYYLASGQSVSTFGLFAALNEFRKDANLSIPNTLQVTLEDLSVLATLSESGQSANCGDVGGVYAICSNLR